MLFCDLSNFRLSADGPKLTLTPRRWPKRARTLKETSRTHERGKVTFRLNLLFNVTVYYIKICSRRGVICTSEVFEAAQFIFEAQGQTILDKWPGIILEYQLFWCDVPPLWSLCCGCGCIHIYICAKFRLRGILPPLLLFPHCNLPTSSDMLLAF